MRVQCTKHMPGQLLSGRDFAQINFLQEIIHPKSDDIRAGFPRSK